MSGSGARPKRVIIFGRLPDGREAVQIIVLGPIADNGRHDAITAKEVIGWFSEAAPNWVAPVAESSSLFAFVAALNILRASEPQRRDTGSLTYQRLERVKKAIGALLDDLPALIEGARRSRQMGNTWISDERDAAVEHLHESAVAAQKAFLWLPRRERHEPWHDAAAVIAWHARAAWREAGRKSVGLKAENPLAAVVATALSRIGEGDRTQESIVKALRRRHRKGRTTQNFGSGYDRARAV